MLNTLQHTRANDHIKFWFAFAQSRVSGEDSIKFDYSQDWQFTSAICGRSVSITIVCLDIQRLGSDVRDQLVNQRSPMFTRD